MKEEKACSKCHQILSLDNFYVDRRTASGRYSACKKCIALFFKSNTTLARRRKDYARYYRRNPQKVLARRLAYNHTAKQNHCEVCKTTADLQLHHPDYSKPLVVMTVCRRCHQIITDEQAMNNKL